METPQDFLSSIRLLSDIGETSLYREAVAYGCIVLW